MQKWHNRILFHYADILWAVMHRDYRDCVNVLPKECSSCFKNIQNIFLELSAGQVRQNCRATLVIPPGTSVATIVTICCNHRDGEYFLHRITRKLGSTATSTVITRPLPLTNYISDAENETQRALLGHTNGNIEMRSPSAAAMLTMVAAATIVRFPPVIMILSKICRARNMYLCVDSVKFLLEARGASILWGHYYFVTTCRPIWGCFY